MLARFATRAPLRAAASRGPGARFIQTGEEVPDKAFLVIREDGKPVDVPRSELFSGRKVVVVGIPGAFTPVCRNQHLPPFVQRFDELKSKGVDEVLCATVNDPFVCAEFAKAIEGVGKVSMLADWNADFAKSIDQDIDLGAAALGVRSKRYAMVVDDGKVTHLATEDSPASVEESSVDAVLAAL